MSKNYNVKIEQLILQRSRTRTKDRMISYLCGITVNNH